jgi:hypothetical protein
MFAPARVLFSASTPMICDRWVVLSRPPYLDVRPQPAFRIDWLAHRAQRGQVIRGVLPRFINLTTTGCRLARA